MAPKLCKRMPAAVNAYRPHCCQAGRLSMPNCWFFQAGGNRLGRVLFCYLVAKIAVWARLRDSKLSFPRMLLGGSSCNSPRSWVAPCHKHSLLLQALYSIFLNCGQRAKICPNGTPSRSGETARRDHSEFLPQSSANLNPISGIFMSLSLVNSRRTLVKRSYP